MSAPGRLLLALLASCLVPAAAVACPPPPPGYVPMTPEQLLRYDVDHADAIVFARIERAIGHGEVDPYTDDFTGDPGTIRILHVYKGDLRVGQRLRLYGQSFETDCGSYHYQSRAGRTGMAGVLLLHFGPGSGRNPQIFPEFRPEADVREMIRLGLIRSARTAAR